MDENLFGSSTTLLSKHYRNNLYQYILHKVLNGCHSQLPDPKVQGAKKPWLRPSPLPLEGEVIVVAISHIKKAYLY